LEFLTPLRSGKELSQVERWKLARHPLNVYQDVIDVYSVRGVSAINAVEGEQERLKWVGLYPQRQGGDAFMVRVKVPGGLLTSLQARTIGEAAAELARGPEPHPLFGSAYCDVTTRQSIQLHWVKIEDVPTLWRKLEEVGLTTVQACGDSSRNVLCCPVSGIDAEEAFDAYPVAKAISDYFTGNREYANLPRKFKMSVTGCLEDCAQAEINDIGLWPARRDDGTLGFNVLVGGGLSDGPRMASDIDVFVTPDQAVEATRAIAQLYGELGNRENRGLCRMRYLVQELGPERFREEMARRASFELAPAGESLTRRYRGDHIGVHPQKPSYGVEGKKKGSLFYVGLNVTVGRLVAEGLVGLADLADRYGDGTIRLTTDQNVILAGVSQEALDDLLAEPLLQVHSPNPRPFERGVVACTGTEFCRFAIVETKARASTWARMMDDRFASHMDGQVVRMHMSGCSASCAQPQIGDVAFRGETAFYEGRIVEAVDVGVGGSLGPDSRFVDWVEAARPVDEVPDALGRLFDRYLAERRHGESFRSWVRRKAPSEVRTTLTPELPDPHQGAVEVRLRPQFEAPAQA
jgi:ferredoxin-nitrite reductase